MTPATLIKSTGLRCEVIAQVLGVKANTVRQWSCGAQPIPPARLEQLKDLAEAVRQVLAERGQTVAQSPNRNH